MLSDDSPPDDYDGRRRSPTRSNITSDSGDLKRRNINPKSAGCDKQNANIILILRYVKYKSLRIRREKYFIMVAWIEAIGHMKSSRKKNVEKTSIDRG